MANEKSEHDRLMEQVRTAESRLAFAIGTFVMRFAMLEGAINHAIGVILRTPTMDVTKVVTAPIINVNIRLDILSSLINGYKMKKETRSQFNTEIGKSRKLNDYRNWLVHDQWGGYMPVTDHWQKIKPEVREKFRLKKQNFSPEEINKKSDDCARLIGDFYDTTRAYVSRRDKPKPSR